MLGPVPAFALGLLLFSQGTGPATTDTASRSPTPLMEAGMIVLMICSDEAKKTTPMESSTGTTSSSGAKGSGPSPRATAMAVNGRGRAQGRVEWARRRWFSHVAVPLKRLVPRPP